MYFDPYDNAPFSFNGPPEVNPNSNTGNFTALDHPFTPCAPLGTTIPAPYILYSNVYRASERPFIADGDATRVAASIWKQGLADKRIGTDKILRQVNTDEINLPNVRIAVSIVYYTTRNYDGWRSFPVF